MSDAPLRASATQEDWWAPEQLAPGSLEVFPSEQPDQESAAVVRILIATGPLHAALRRVRQVTTLLLAAVAIAGLVVVGGVHGDPAVMSASPTGASSVAPSPARDSTPGAQARLLDAVPMTSVAPLKHAISRHAATATATPTPLLMRADLNAIRRVLNGYRDAMSTLNVPALRLVWPAVDVTGVERQFADIIDQNLEFISCRIWNSGPAARAQCAGLVESGFSPGRSRPQVANLRWQFALRKVQERWIITSVTHTPQG
jgi:hypothetical protein